MYSTVTGIDSHFIQHSNWGTNCSDTWQPKYGIQGKSDTLLLEVFVGN